MAGAALRLMEADEFLVWSLGQEARYELVDGVPVEMKTDGAPLEMMAGASSVHDTIVPNIIASLHGQLRGTSCRATTADTALRTRIRGFRRPDVTVTCDPPRPDVYEALQPRLAVEVLSPSNKGVAWDRKMREYRRHEALQYILLVDSEVVGVTLYARTSDGWADSDFEKLADVVDLPEIGCRLSLSDIYEATGLTEPDERPDR